MVENDKIITQDIKIAKELNSFSLHVVKSPKIFDFREIHVSADGVINPTLNSILVKQILVTIVHIVLKAWNLAGL